MASKGDYIRLIASESLSVNTMPTIYGLTLNRAFPTEFTDRIPDADKDLALRVVDHLSLRSVNVLNIQVFNMLYKAASHATHMISPEEQPSQAAFETSHGERQGLPLTPKAMDMLDTLLRSMLAFSLCVCSGTTTTTHFGRCGADFLFMASSKLPQTIRRFSGCTLSWEICDEREIAVRGLR